MNTFGHSGCQLPGETFHQWGWDMSDCECRLGTYGNTWTFVFCFLLPLDLLLTPFFRSAGPLGNG